MREPYPHHEDVHKAADDRYASLPYRRAGRSGLDLPAVSLGLWQKFGDDHAYDTPSPRPSGPTAPRPSHGC
jgi:L-glyceraldehyde 3-phosphate reductase